MRGGFGFDLAHHVQMVVHRGIRVDANRKNPAQLAIVYPDGLLAMLVISPREWINPTDPGAAHRSVQVVLQYLVPLLTMCEPTWVMAAIIAGQLPDVCQETPRLGVRSFLQNVARHRSSFCRTVRVPVRFAGPFRTTPALRFASAISELPSRKSKAPRCENLKNHTIRGLADAHAAGHQRTALRAEGVG